MHLKFLEQMTKPSNASRAAGLVFVPIAIGQIVSSLETLTIGRLYRRNAVLRGVSARDAEAGSVRHRALTVLDGQAAPLILAAVNLTASSVMLMAGKKRKVQIATSAIIALSNRLNEIRTPYGRDGADQMTAVVTQYRVISAFIPDKDRSDDLFLRAVNLQAGLSYLASGVGKLFGSRWIQGDALGEILSTDVYGGSPMARVLKRFPRLTRLLSWSTPIWETALPLIYLLPRRSAHATLLGVKGFHIVVAAVMELPRFVWGFFGSHGAVKYVLDRPEFGARRWSGVESVTVGAAVAFAAVSATYATTTRQMDILRRKGIKGNQFAALEDGVVEYSVTRPQQSEASPVVILECGLGVALESWAWVRNELSEDCIVIAYHRSGYGLTTSEKSPGELVSRILEDVVSSGPTICVAHSIGMLSVREYAENRVIGRSIDAVVVIDGTDPELLRREQSNRHRLGAFLQSQLHTMCASLLGVYNYAPNAVARQAAYPPDEQSGNLQFAYSPKNIYRAVREYFAFGREASVRRLRDLPVRRLVSSQEFATQQKALADKLGATYKLIEGSSHRTILGREHFARQVTAEIRRAINDV